MLEAAAIGNWQANATEIPMAKQQSQALNTTIKRKSSHHREHHRVRKKGKILISETLIEESRTLISSSSSDLHAVKRHSSKKRHRKRKKPELGVEGEQRQWNYSARDFSSYRGMYFTSEFL